MTYGFSLRWKGKPAPPRETVTIHVHEVKCSCGVLWLAPPDLAAPGCQCPECGERARPGRIGPLQPHTVTIPLAFRGNGNSPR